METLGGRVPNLNTASNLRPGDFDVKVSSFNNNPEGLEELAQLQHYLHSKWCC